jgi:prepilin-type N-terminal cleavage/methylation domain-containing protein
MKGFTLIEVVVSVAVALVVTGFIIVNYNSYNDVQALKQAALTLKNNLRFAQSKASTGEKPASCSRLSGYTISFTSMSYSIEALCAPEGLVGARVAVSLPGGVLFSPIPDSFSFNVLSGGTTLGSTTVLRLVGSGKQYDIQVSPGGDVSDLGMQ